MAVIGLAAAGVLAWWWQNTPKPAPMAAAGAAAPGAPGPARGPGGPGGAGGPAPVEVAQAQTATLTDDVQAVGSLKSNQGVMLRPEVSGRVAKLGFADGQRVRRGQLLVQLDDTLQQAQLKQSEAQASIARTNLQRSRELLGQGFISQSAVDQNAASLEVAEAQVALARAQLARLKVLAPFDGTAGIRLVDVGDYVKDGADIVNIEDLSSLKVQFTVPERTIDRLRPGQAVDVAVDALPGRNFKGRVQAIDSQVDANGRALQVVAQVENPGALLKPGMFARPRVVFAVREGAIVVPEEALVPLGGKQVVFKLVEGADGKKVAQRVDARIGLRLPGKVEILDGLKAGDSVITAGHERLLRGNNLAVRVIDLAKAGGAGGGGKPVGGPASGPAAGGPSGVPAGAVQVMPAASAARATPV
ncbi:MAG: efflux RND transporter periplasmic adaptor subunit [Betaproteobacteria bacterium]|nr:efflux RND transporter periplasmic adaptor subunit [Betaproteobacteria bacterium]